MTYAIYLLVCESALNIDRMVFIESFSTKEEAVASVGMLLGKNVYNRYVILEQYSN